MWKPMVRSRDSEAVPETRGAPVDRQRQILIRHYNRTGFSIQYSYKHNQMFYLTFDVFGLYQRPSSDQRGRKDGLMPWIVMRAATNSVTPMTALLTQHFPVVSRTRRTEHQLLLMKGSNRGWYVKCYAKIWLCFDGFISLSVFQPNESVFWDMSCNVDWCLFCACRVIVYVFWARSLTRIQRMQCSYWSMKFHMLASRKTFLLVCRQCRGPLANRWMFAGRREQPAYLRVGNLWFERYLR